MQVAVDVESVTLNCKLMPKSDCPTVRFGIGPPLAHTCHVDPPLIVLSTRTLVDWFPMLTSCQVMTELPYVPAEIKDWEGEIHWEFVPIIEMPKLLNCP